MSDYKMMENDEKKLLNNFYAFATFGRGKHV